VTLAEVPCQGAAVVYQYLNAPYTQSPELFPPLQSGVLTAAEGAGALLVRLENVYITPVTGGSFPGWSQAAQLLQQVWMARNASTGASPGTRAAAVMAAAQPYTGLEQYYSIACNEAPSPPASAFVGLQRLVLRRGGVIGLPYLWSLDEPCATWPARGQAHLQRPVERPHQPHPGDRQHHRPVPPAPRRHRHDPPARQRPATDRARLRPHRIP
jgi:hypothetical protein